jgi:hypothetical protein
MGARSEQSKKIFHAQTHVLNLVTTQRCLRKRAFLVLKLEDSVFNGSVDLKLIDVNVSRLAKSVRTIEGLVLRIERGKHRKNWMVSYFCEMMRMAGARLPLRQDSTTYQPG